MSTSNSSPTFTMGQCPVCLEEEALFILPCNPTHTGYCRNCHTETLRHLQEGDLQPQCPFCATSIPIQIFESIVPAEIYATITTRMLEWGIPTDQRLYCSNTDCLKFIPFSAPTSSSGRQCAACGTITCLSCKHSAHNGACPEDQGLEAAVEAAQADGGKKCPACGEVVLRGEGCQHISSHSACHHEWCFLCLADWKDCLGSCQGSHEDARRVHGDDTEDEGFEISPEENEELDAEEAADAARLDAEFGHLDLWSADQLLRLLQAIAIVYSEDIIRSEPEVAESLHLAAHDLIHVTEGDGPLEQGLQRYTAWCIISIRDRRIPILTGPGKLSYANNEQILEDFLWPLRQSRTDEFIDAEDEAIELLSHYDDPDLAEKRRFHENLLLSLVGTDYEPTLDLAL
ncbi:hypothetical protein KCU99_g9843, partial [Aureobasidium melanogenum]